MRRAACLFVALLSAELAVSHAEEGTRAIRVRPADRQANGHGIPSSASTPEIPREIRSVIGETDVFFALGNGASAQGMKEMALAEAERQLLGKAREHLAALGEGWSHSTLTYKVLSSHDYGVGNDGRFHLWTCGEVQYALPPRDDFGVNLPTQSQASPRAPLTVELWTNKSSYHEGESVVIYLQGNRNFYARVVDKMPNGNAYQLLPNEYRAEAFFEANRVYAIPDNTRGDRFDLQVSPPFGRDEITVYASAEPMGEIKRVPVGNGGLYRCLGGEEAIAAGSRGIRVRPVRERPPDLQLTEFYERRCTITTNR